MPDGSRPVTQDNEFCEKELYLQNLFKSSSLGLCSLARRDDFIVGSINRQAFKEHFQIEFSAVADAYTVENVHSDLARKAVRFLNENGIELNAAGPLPPQR